MKRFLMDKCPKDEPTAKNLTCKKLFPLPRKIGKTCWGGGGGKKDIEKKFRLIVNGLTKNV